jgi:hypothetical protein
MLTGLKGRNAQRAGTENLRVEIADLPFSEGIRVP